MIKETSAQISPEVIQKLTSSVDERLGKCLKMRESGFRVKNHSGRFCYSLHLF